MQLHPLPDIKISVSAEGRDSVTVTTPVVAIRPVFDTVMVYAAPCCERRKIPAWLLVILSTGASAPAPVSDTEAIGTDWSRVVTVMLADTTAVAIGLNVMDAVPMPPFAAIVKLVGETLKGAPAANIKRNGRAACVRHRDCSRLTGLPNGNGSEIEQ